MGFQSVFQQPLTLLSRHFRESLSRSPRGIRGGMRGTKGIGECRRARHFRGIRDHLSRGNIIIQPLSIAVLPCADRIDRATARLRGIREHLSGEHFRNRLGSMGSMGSMGKVRYFRDSGEPLSGSIVIFPSFLPIGLIGPIGPIGPIVFRNSIAFREPLSRDCFSIAGLEPVFDGFQIGRKLTFGGFAQFAAAISVNRHGALTQGNGQQLTAQTAVTLPSAAVQRDGECRKLLLIARPCPKSVLAYFL